MFVWAPTKLVGRMFPGVMPVQVNDTVLLRRFFAAPAVVNNLAPRVAAEFTKNGRKQ